MSSTASPPAWKVARGGERLALGVYPNPPPGRRGGRVLPRPSAVRCRRPGVDARFQVPGPLVDLGCGVGRHALRFARRGFPVVAVELSQPMLARSASTGDDRASGCLLGVRANLCRLGAFPDRTFAYAALDVQHPGDDPRRIVAQAGPRRCRVLRPGGRLALHAPQPLPQPPRPPGADLAARPGGQDGAPTTPMLATDG